MTSIHKKYTIDIFSSTPRDQILKASEHDKNNLFLNQEAANDFFLSIIDKFYNLSANQFDSVSHLQYIDLADLDPSKFVKQ